MARRRLAAICLLSSVFCLLTLTPSWAAKPGIRGTKHDLSVSGGGEMRAGEETRVCIFCHTPHNAEPQTPLWNQKLEAVQYNLYESSTLSTAPNQPSGATRLCLSCHDGTIAIGEVPERSQQIEKLYRIGPERSALIGTDISDDHPVSFLYYDSLPDAQLNPSLPPDLLFYGDGIMHCSTCHDPHDDRHGNFLVVDNIRSALCTKCHVMQGWTLSSHSQSASVWNGAGPDPWPRTSWATVADNACENCHTPHNAGGPKRLLNYLEEEQNCYPCHNGNVAEKNIEAQFKKFSTHPVRLTTIDITGNYHDPAEDPTYVSRHVECVDCHNPHATSNSPSQAPYVPGSEEQVTGVDENRLGVDPAIREYEICFKCHTEPNRLSPFYIERYANENETFMAVFNTGNPSFHPVIGPRNAGIPSIPSPEETEMTSATVLYCTDCHDSDESPAVGGSGPKGPHGSSYWPILRSRYETADNTMESYENYSLCYRCHKRDSILSDESFEKRLSFTTANGGGHSGHLAIGAPCSACHDPHGVRDDLLPGDQTHLINFDTAIVSPLPGAAQPFFIESGPFLSAGEGNKYCLLVCHGRSHDNCNSTYP